MRKGNLVSIEFFHNGRRWKADTPEEAVRLRRQLRLEDLQQRGAPEGTEDVPSNDWSPEAFQTFLNRIGEQQKLAVRLMAENPGISNMELARRLHLENELVLAGVISGLSRQLRAVGIELDRLYTVTTRWKGKKKTRLFYLQAGFRRAAEEAGWPEKENPASKHRRSA